MTRLEKHTQKVFYQKVTAMVVLLLVLIVFIFLIGFQFILKSSGFVGGLSSKSDVTSSQGDEFYGTLSVDELPSATNSAQFVISGSTTNYDKVEYYINDEKVDSTPIQSGNFSKVIGDLHKGKNSVHVNAITSDRKHVKKSDTFLITFKTDKPKLDISSPSDNSKTDKPDITVSGSTDKDVTIQINDSPTVVDANGGFSQSLTLKEGDNKIVVKATDDAGNVEEKDITVNYQKD